MWSKFLNWLKGDTLVSSLVQETLYNLVSKDLLDVLQQLILDAENSALSGQEKKQAVIGKALSLKGILGANVRALPPKLLSIAINGLVYQLQVQGKL